MGVAGQPQRANHIRSISGLFLSRTLSVETRVPQSVCGPELECRVTGRPGSPCRSRLRLPAASGLASRPSARQREGPQ